jgi:hypothetical protein
MGKCQTIAGDVARRVRDARAQILPAPGSVVAHLSEVEANYIANDSFGAAAIGVVAALSAGPVALVNAA